MNYIICKRSIIEVNIDPLGRCYDGCHAKSEFVWTDWEKLEYWSSQEIADRRIKFWRELNDYAVSQRGESAKTEFKIVTM